MGKTLVDEVISLLSEKETGLIVKGALQRDTDKLKKFIDDSDWYGEYNRDGDYFFFPEEKSMYDELEKSLEKEFNKRNIHATFEGI